VGGVLRLVERTVVLGCAVVAVVAVSIGPTAGPGSIGQTNLYDWATRLQLALLVAGGLALLVTSLPLVRRAAAIVAFSAGAQLAGTGIVARRRWMTSAGFGGRAHNLAELRAMAVLLAVAGFVAAAACLIALWRSGAIARRPEARTVVVALAIGTIVALWIPFAMGYEPFNRRTQVGAHALMYSLPWAGVLALSGLLDRVTAAVAVLVVVVSAVPLTRGEVMIPAPNETLAASMALIAGFVLITFRWLTRPASSS
jgi:hypothetical protein